MDTPGTEAASALQIAGFWQRIGALLIDLVLLGLFGAILGACLFDPLARMGMWARLIGFAIALAYFGLCNSKLNNGRTLGKQWLRLRVVDVHGQTLSVPRSLLRYAVLGIPFFVNGLPLDPQNASSVLGYLLALVVFGAGLAIVYLYIFNRRTRQSLHDLVVGSYVVRTEPTLLPTPLRTVWHGHLVVAAIVAVIALSAPAVASRFVKSSFFADMDTVYQSVSTQPHVKTAQVMRGWSSFNGNTSHSLQASLRLDARMTEDGTIARNAAMRMAKADPHIDQEDAVVVVLVYGYDMGIASGWRSHVYSFKPEELR